MPEILQKTIVSFDSFLNVWRNKNLTDFKGNAQLSSSNFNEMETKTL